MKRCTCPAIFPHSNVKVTSEMSSADNEHCTGRSVLPPLRPSIHPMKLSVKIVRWKHRSHRLTDSSYTKATQQLSTDLDISTKSRAHETLSILPQVDSRSRLSILNFPLQDEYIASDLMSRDRNICKSSKSSAGVHKLTRMKWIDALGCWVTEDQRPPVPLTSLTSNTQCSFKNPMTSSEKSGKPGQTKANTLQKYSLTETECISARKEEVTAEEEAPTEIQVDKTDNLIIKLKFKMKKSKHSISPNADKNPLEVDLVKNANKSPPETNTHTGQQTIANGADVSLRDITSNTTNKYSSAKENSVTRQKQTTEASKKKKIRMRLSNETKQQKLKQNPTSPTDHTDQVHTSVSRNEATHDLSVEEDSPLKDETTYVSLMNDHHTKRKKVKPRRVKFDKTLDNETNKDETLNDTNLKEQKGSALDLVNNITEENEADRSESTLWSVPELPELNLGSQDTRKLDMKKVVSLVAPNTSKLSRRPKQIDPDFLKAMFLQQLAEERRRKLYFGFTKRRSKFNLHSADKQMDNSRSLEHQVEDDYLHQYCIYQEESLHRYRQVFDAFDDKRRGWLNHKETMRALQVVNSDMKGTELQYLNRILELMDCDVSQGTDFQVFSILCALSHKIVSLDSWIKLKTCDVSYSLLDMKAFLCKTLWEICVDQDKRAITTDQLVVLLRSGGLSDRQESIVKEMFSHRSHIDYLTFLTYSPLFVMLHQSVVERPLFDY
ncbi:mucin-5ac-like isoform x4 [Biomphalaria glabrata]|nr:neurofilament heavy polypeptide-like isoform X11 [Biomphalaria glabrata]